MCLSQGMEESLFESTKVAAGCINGELKNTVFRQFLKLINSYIVSQGDISGFPCSALFVATAYEVSTDDEKKILSKQITEELTVMPELVETLRLFWKRGQ